MNPKARRVVALVGGLADRTGRCDTEAIELRSFGSVRDGGTGELRRLLTSIEHGGIDEVWLLVCWLGHSQSRTILRACRKRGVAIRLLGGRGQARRETRR